MNSPTIKLTLKRSVAGRTKNHRACVKGLGLGRTGSASLVLDTPQNCGMIQKVAYLLTVEK